MTTTQLMMPLLNEGTEVWRPVAAWKLNDGTYHILGPQPDGEEWAFPPGSLVASETRRFTGGELELVAVRAEGRRDGAT